MAKVYYVKDGSYPQNMVDPFGRRVALAELERRLEDKDLHYLGSLPKAAQKLHQFLSSGLPRSSMEFSP
jgi:hypothetical protein